MQCQLLALVLGIWSSTRLCESTCKNEYGFTTCNESSDIHKLINIDCESRVIINSKNDTKNHDTKNLVRRWFPLPEWVTLLTIIGSSTKVYLDNFKSRHTFLKFLSFYDSNLKNLNENFFEIDELVELNFVNGGIEEIKPGAFTGVQALTINLSDNQLELITKGSFTSSRQNKTKKISLERNKIRFIETGSFPPTLECLLLNHNRLRVLSPSIFDDLPELKTLHVDYNLLGVFEFGTFPKLHSLSLSHNQIVQVDFKQFRKDRSHSRIEFFLDHNEIHELDPENIPLDISTLELSHNKIRQADFLKRPLAEDSSVTFELSLAFNRLQSLNFGNDFVAKRRSFAFLDGNPWQCGQWIESQKFMERIDMFQLSCKLHAVNDGKIPFCIGCARVERFFPKKNVSNSLCDFDVDKFRYFLNLVDPKISEKCKLSRDPRYKYLH